DLANQVDHRRNLLGVDLVSRNLLPGALLDRFGDRVALGPGAAREVDLAEDVGVHRHLVHADGADPARTDYQHFRHSYSASLSLEPLRGLLNARSHREMR